MKNQELEPSFYEWAVPYFGMAHYSRRQIELGNHESANYTKNILKIGCVSITEGILFLGFFAGLEKLLN